MVEEASLVPEPDQARPSTPANTTVGEPLDLDRQKRFPVVIPYVKGKSKQLRRGITGCGLKLYVKPTKTLRKILLNPKKKLINERIVCPVYHISCNNCDDLYTGEVSES